MYLAEDLYQGWLLHLQIWAADGRLFAAGCEAIRLEPGQATQRLKRMVDRLAQGNTLDLPPIEVLPGDAMAGAMGAYASATGTIYLNRDWLNKAPTAAAQAVLTEEFGHHLDQLLSEEDTQGDEGQIFANALIDPRVNFKQKNNPTESDYIKIFVKGKWIVAEAALSDPTDRSDTITGTANSEIIKGLGGADSLDGQGGNDTIHGGAGKDSIHGGLGNDSIWGQDGADTLWGDDPSDTISGGDDTIEGHQGKDTIYGGAGNDSISGGDVSSNLIYGGNGNDLIQSFGFNSSASDDKSKDTLYGEGGNDTLKGGNGRDKIYGGEDNDFLQGNGNWDSLYGGNGNDTINGNRGADWIWGDEGDDILRGFSSSPGTDNGSNRINGGAGNDTISGANKRDTLHGGPGNDSLRGNSHADKLFGNGGDDILHGGKSYDNLAGGTGADVYHFREPHKAHVHKDAIHQRHGHSVRYTSETLISSNTVLAGGALTFANGVDLAIYGVGAAENKFWGRNRNGAGAGIFLPNESALELLNTGDSTNNLSIFGNYMLRGSWTPSSGDLSTVTLEDRIGSFTQNDDGEDVILLYNVVNKDLTSSENTNYLVVTDAFKNGTNLISAVIRSNDEVKPTAANDTATVERLATSYQLDLLDNDSDADDSARWISDDAFIKHLAIKSIGGVAFANLSDSTDSSYPAASGYKEISSTYGTLYLKQNGIGYYKHDTQNLGTETFSYTTADSGGNESEPASLTLLITDTTAPTVQSISSSTADGTYTTGDTITINVLFSEDVTVNTTGGTPQLTLETGSTDQNASYSSGSGTNTLAFSYTVQDGDTASALNYKATSSLALNGATIQDASNNDAALTLPALASSDSLAANSALVIDTTAPVITGPSGGAGTSTSSHFLTEGGTSVTQMSANETVTWSLGTTGDEALFNIDTTGNLSFKSAADYETPLDSDGDNSYVVNIIASDSGSNQSTQQLTINVTDTDDTGPSITSVSSTNADGEYGIDDTISITVEFTEDVTVVTSGGTPYLILETGTNDKEILYSSGSGSNTLSFTYKIENGDRSNDLEVYSATALQSNGGTIRDNSGNDADLTLTAQGSSNSLSANKEIVIDGVAPILSAPSPIDVKENASNNLELHDFNDLSGGDTDESGDALTYSILSGNSDSIFDINANNGKLVVEDNSLLSHSKSETYLLTIQASDGSNTASTLATINVIDVNNNPVAVDDLISLNENTTAEKASAASGILSNDSDSDGDAITIESFRTGLESESGNFGILGSSREGTYGSLTLHRDGTYSYIADLAAADALAEGVTATDPFTYSVSDDKGWDTGEIIFTITGVNDAPHIVDAIAKKKYTEGQGATIIIDGSLTVTDLDDSTIESATVTISSGYEPSEDVLGFSNTSQISGTWNSASGQLSLSGSASKSAYAAALATVTYSNSDDINPVLGHRTVSWQLNDGSTASNTASSIIDVGGINDSPESQNDAGSVDAGLSLNVTTGSGLLSNDSDPESDDLTVSDIRTGGESQTGTDGSVATALTGDYGQLTVSSDGSYIYSANQAAADALAEGATAIDVFTYTLNDGTDNDLGELTITVTGTNNAPSGSDDSKPVNENESISVSAISGVLINDSDVDGDNLTITAAQTASSASNRTLLRKSLTKNKKEYKPIVLSKDAKLSSSSALPKLTGTYGELTLNKDGSYIYDANQSATDALNEGDSVSDSFTYILSDSKTTDSATLEIVVTGINDYPSIKTPLLGRVDEVIGSTQTQTSGLSGMLTATDVDTNANLEYGILGGSTVDSTTSLAGNYGTLELDTSTGEYTYTPDSSSIEALNTGQSVSDQFRISVSDSMALDSTEYQVLITGASENPSPEATPAPTPEPTPTTSTPAPTPTPTPEPIPTTSTQAPTPTPTPEPIPTTATQTPASEPDPATEPTPDPTLEALLLQESMELDCPISSSKTKTGLEIKGSLCSDVLNGGNKNDVLHGKSGDDLLIGKPGNDFLKGGHDSDLLRGGQGDDILRGGKGGDILRGGTGADQLIGHKGHDLLIGRHGNDLIRGRAGDDTIKGGNGDDIIKGGRGADHIHLSRGQDQILDFKPQRGDRLIGNNKFSFEATEFDGNIILSDINSNTQITLHNISLNAVLAVQPKLFS